MMKLSTETFAKLASAYAGIVFGIYWIPLRALDEAGFPGLWATVGLSIVPLACVTPIILARFGKLANAGLRFHLGSLTLGVAYTLYTSAFVFTEVVNVVVLYYLMPLWGFLLARIVIGEAITPVRWISMAIGFSGMFAIFGLDQGLPIPEKPGDWIALGAGFLWASGSLIVLTDDKNSGFDFSLGFMFWATICSAVMAYAVSSTGVMPMPDFSAIGDIALWLIPVGVLVVLPGSFATIYGPRYLNPGVVGLLFMTEISVGATTAALLTDEPFGPRQIAGVVVISVAGALEAVWDLFRRSRARSAA